MLRASIGELTRDLILGVIKLDLHFVWANVFWITQESYPINFPKCWKQPRGLFKSMDPDSEVKKRERLTKCILKLKDNKLTGVRIELSGSRKPMMLRKSLSSRQNSRVDELKVVNGNRVGQAGFCAERLGWWRNRPSVSVKWDFADQREGHGFLDKKTDKKHRKRPIEINPDRKEGERWPEGRSESRLETAGLSVHCDSV
ncbi:hypothetical protein F2Q68_00005484 [Brassica cretica]|uniref:Uncharacterized protein n=1 Tax=Brassica cretica TaxID=69181 RepID=A0A8S9J8A9_BRACR|nr:hypothetical protein F2Q68_00005484 [Brassica cretica]